MGLRYRFTLTFIRLVLTTTHHPPPLQGLSSSQEDRVPVTLYFVNHSVHMQMEVSWVDYDGRVVPRKVLGPGDALLERSFATHPWIVHSVAPPPVEGTIFTDPGTMPPSHLGWGV